MSIAYLLTPRTISGNFAKMKGSFKKTERAGDATRGLISCSELIAKQ